LSYYDEINQGNKYLCDRCNVVQLRYDEYENNVRDIVDNTEKMRYCDECRNFIILRKFICLKCKSKGTMRNERILPKVCCKQEVSWLK
jgi:hypothetical protein